MTSRNAYDQLVAEMKELATLQSVEEVLWWDQETHMPTKAGDLRSDQFSLLAGMTHDRFTSKKIGDLIAECENSDLTSDPESVTAVNIRELRDDYDRATKLPKRLVQDFAKTVSQATKAWTEARKRSDFSMFKPFLEKLLKLNQEKAQALGFEGEAYDTLMHDYEPGAKVADLEATFKSLRVELVELLGRLKDAPRKPDISILRRHYDLKKQELFGEMVVAALGYDFNSGRLDETTHPFTISLGPQDTRILTRYKENDFAEAFTSSVHEAGHALYDMGLLSEHYGMPMGDVKSLGTHESQSRLWENQIGRSRAFWGYFFPVAQRLFRETLSDVTLDQMYGVMNYVEPGYIRVEADEATYNLHIMLRFEMERAMLNGDISVDEVPGEWNKRFKEYLGLEVDCDANGCLQDIHWAHGTLGYFPTYSLGNMYSAQYYAKARKDLPNLDADFAAGDFSRLLGWLRENIHQHGRRYLPGDLCKKVTGEPLSAKPLLDYLKAKYAEIYGI